MAQLRLWSCPAVPASVVTTPGQPLNSSVDRPAYVEGVHAAVGFVLAVVYPERVDPVDHVLGLVDPNDQDNVRDAVPVL